MVDLKVNLTFGGFEYGRWCEACNLPSAVKVDVLNLRDDGVSKLTETVVCLDCGTRR